MTFFGPFHLFKWFKKVTFTFLPLGQVTAGAGREAVAPRSSASFQTRDRRKRSETTSYERSTVKMVKGRVPLVETLVVSLPGIILVIKDTCTQTRWKQTYTTTHLFDPCCWCVDDTVMICSIFSCLGLDAGWIHWAIRNLQPHPPCLRQLAQFFHKELWMIHKLILCCAQLHNETKETSEAYKTPIVPFSGDYIIWNSFRIVSGHHENCFLHHLWTGETWSWAIDWLVWYQV